jgi:hypothetical protein
MEDNLKNSLLTVCSLLDKHNVQYMLVGGAAVALNGYYRLSKTNSGELTEKPDIDIWYNPTYGNYYNLLKVLEELGLDITELKNEKSPNPRKSFLQLKFDDFTLDLLPNIKASIKFLSAYKRKETVEFEETTIHYINYADLVEDKRATARKKDLEDIEQLKKLNEED